ncbi:tail fiber protein [Bacteroides phage BF698P3]|nr:tail fiber protein [Bacteroides phage BF698P3]
MNTFNNFSPLAFREKSMKATYKKWYAYGKEFALPFSTTELPPFQFTVANLPSFDPTTVEVFLVDEATGVRSGTGIKIKVDTMDEHNSVLYVSPGSNMYAKSIEPGVYRAEFTIPEGETYVSTPICVTDGIETSTNFVKLEYWNDEKLAYPNGFVTTGTDNDFKFQMYIPTTFFKPKYEFEEEITKRAGYKFLELQTCNKVFGFNFLAPEYICDALRLVRLSDYIRFTHDGEYYNALNFEYNPDWQDNGYLAAIECQFETDTIIQKLPSFNRRDRESFYNALLADIDTPILFSPDVVGLYYREFKQGEPTIKGKLIRELSPIDLIDENTTIAVDMGAGEARKFNLYRMLEGYISKNHEDVTEFLLSLRGGVNIGTPNTSGEYPASVDRDGNTKLKDIQGNDATLNNITGKDATLNNVTGKDATFKTVETGFLTVNKTSATIDGMGNANVNDLTARGDSMLRSDVYTGSKNGSHTGKITKEGQLQYLSAIIYEFLSSETFVPGFLGEGFKIWLENGNWHIECDNLTVRQTMNIFELLIQKIRSVNGAIVVSQSNGKVTAVEDTGTQYKITFGEEFPTFQEGDLIRCQSWSKNNLKFYWVEVKTAADGYILCDKSEFNNVVPAVGDEVVQMGNTKNTERQALIYITAQESGKPYIEILNGVKTKSLTGTDRTRLGDLSNIVDPDFTGEAAVKGTGFYSTNAFLKGIFVLRNGKRVEDEIKIAKDAADQAAQDAAKAAQSAQEAKDRLNKWADDGFISPTEKPALIDEGKRIQAEYLQIKANADKYGVLVTEYTEAYNNYLNELRYHSAATPEDIAVRPELAQSQTAYYDKRNGALNAIATASKDYVDNADKQLKEYLDTEITAIPGKIELAVRSLKVADVNLLKGAYKELKNADYGFGAYSYDVPLVNGKEYTLTVCYTLSANNTHIQVYSDGGSNRLSNFDTKGSMIVESKKVTMVGYKPDTKLTFFQFPQGTYGSKVHWAVLTDGNLGVTSWIPSASEKSVGLRNLCSFKRITDAGFTYAMEYKEDGHIGINLGVLNAESSVPEKDMFGLVYDDSKRYVLFIDDVDYGYEINPNTKTMYINVKYKDGTSEGIQLVGTKPSKDYIITSKPVKCIVGTYYVAYNPFARIGLYETYELVSWSPAPEDQLYQSVKYTDTQILAVDGKIELSVKTKVESLGIGANNLYSYTSSPLNQLYPMDTIDRKTDIHGFYLVGEQGAGGAVRIPNIIPAIPGKYTVSGWIKGTQSTRVGFYIDICDSGRVRVDSNASNTWSYFKHTFDVTKNTEAAHSTYNFVDLEEVSWAYVWVKDFKVEFGEVATAWSPNEADSVYLSKEYTTQQISIVEGKITSTVEQINTVDGKVTGLASRVTQTESSINSVVGDVNILNSTTNRHITKQIDLTGWDNNKFFPLSINLPVYYKAKIVISRPLNTAYGKPSYGAHDGGFSMNLSFEMSGSGYGSLPAVTNIFDYTRAWSTGKIVVDLGQITQTSTCIMGIRGGSKYDVTVHDTTDPNVINVYQTDYHGSYDTSFPVRTDGTEPVRTYGYYSEIKQTQESLSATVAKVDDQGRRLSAAELTLTADNARIGVVENGLVNTGINITSRKIVLKSDNVLFQNNAGQQTAAINANGRLTANVIEAGEVVANGFAAQRITTGNLTVTDGAVIAGMTISGGVLTGKNINIIDGAKVGSFTISSGIFSAQEVPAGIQMTLAGNAATFDSSGVRVENNSGGYALTTTGKGKIFLTGSDFWVQCKDVDFMGAQTWKAPGVFYACTILANGAIGKTWGNPDFHITRVTKNSTGRYTVNTTGSNGDYFVMITAYDPSSWLSTTVEPYSEGQFTYKVFDVNNGMRDGGVIIYFCGMVR